MNNDGDSLNEIIGIASEGFGCNGSNPKVFIRVSESVDWIEKIVWPTDKEKPDTRNSAGELFKSKNILIFTTILAVILGACNLQDFSSI